MSLLLASAASSPGACGAPTIQTASITGVLRLKHYVRHVGAIGQSTDVHDCLVRPSQMAPHRMYPLWTCKLDFATKEA
jgi:hypothetical protein